MHEARIGPKVHALRPEKTWPAASAARVAAPPLAALLLIFLIALARFTSGQAPTRQEPEPEAQPQNRPQPKLQPQNRPQPKLQPQNQPEPKPDAEQERENRSQPSEQRLRRIVAALAAPEMEGRSGEGARKAAAYLIDEFRRLKLEPLFGDQFVQEIPATEPARLQGRNVASMLRSNDPALRDEWVIVSAHYDHLGVRAGKLYPGADDNASGVAMMLEVARVLAGGDRPPRRSLMFIGFDLEEKGLFGSRYFVAHPPVPLRQVVLFVTADMIGRSLLGLGDRRVFVLGTEHAPSLRPWLDQAARGQPLQIGLLGSDVLILDRSDYGPFRSRQVPYLFFSTGENPCYHSPDDTAETLDYPKLTAISRVICRVTAVAASEAAVPRWSADPDNPLAEAVTLRDVLRMLHENQRALAISGAPLYLISSTLHNLEDIIGRGAVTPPERASIVQAARLILLWIH